MWSNRMRASTLVEMLVTMIISGVVILSVFEGIGMFRRMLAGVSDIEQLGEPLRSHSVIMRLSGNCDSAIYDGNRLLLFTGDNAEDTLLLNNDAVLWHNGGKPSELFPGMRGYEIVLSGAGMADSLIVKYRKKVYSYGLHSE